MLLGWRRRRRRRNRQLAVEIALQKVVRELICVVGLGDALAIVARWGGRSLRVPTSVRRFDPLAVTLGFVTATRLAAAFGGRELQLRSARSALMRIRNRVIVRASERGVSDSRIAAHVGLTRQRVRQVIDAARGSRRGGTA